jgi:RNA polymerase sigma factor (sigma-70 family)
MKTTGARAPFEAVVAEHGPAVLRVCRALVGVHDADDAWVETFISAMRAYPDLEPGSNIRGWLVTIAHNRSIDTIRARSRRAARTEPTAPADFDGIVPTSTSRPVPAAFEDTGPDDRSSHERLHRALHALAPKQRDAVVYRYLADLPYSEVAELLGTTQAAARRNASDGIAKLRSRLTGTPS